MSETGIGPRIGALLRDVLEAIALAVVLFFVLQFGIQSTVVEGVSMEPNFVDGEWVLVNKLAYRLGEPSRGDVVVFHAPGEVGKDYIKRVLATEGEEIVIRNEVVRIDGRVVEEAWLPRTDRIAFGPFTVPSGQVVVLGDNRPSSNDSRSWANPGLSVERVVGKVFVSVWPPRSFGLVHADRPGPTRRRAAAASP
jgi:signal peptidase I